jgi:hypothetical protein
MSEIPQEYWDWQKALDRLAHDAKRVGIVEQRWYLLRAIAEEKAAYEKYLEVWRRQEKEKGTTIDEMTARLKATD